MVFVDICVTGQVPHRAKGALTVYYPFMQAMRPSWR